MRAENRSVNLDGRSKSSSDCVYEESQSSVNEEEYSVEELEIETCKRRVQYVLPSPAKLVLLSWRKDIVGKEGDNKLASKPLRAPF